MAKQPKTIRTIPQDRTAMAEQDPKVRVANFTEVALGYTEDEAALEAERCLMCTDPTCISGCPVQIDIPGFIQAICDKDIRGAYDIMMRDNLLPAICGRVCPQEIQCEAECVRGAKGEPVAIGYLERFVADWAMEHTTTLQTPVLPEQSGKRVVVVGCGPAGLTAAGELAGKGHEVTIVEALHDTGGVLRYGIPEFRLPKSIIDNEIDRLMDRGVKIECNVIVGKTMTLTDLQGQYDAVFISNGAGLPTLLDMEGENLKGVYAANEYLTRVNLMGAGQVANCPTPIIKGKNVAVIGGGNTAMDCVRTARRLGAERAMIVYRREEEQMPARVEEVHHAKEEGVEFVMLSSPLEILGDEKGWVKSMLCQRMVLGENVGQAFLFVRSGNAELGFVAASQLVGSNPVPMEGSLWEVPENLYRPIGQQAVLLSDTRASRAFMAYVRSEEAARIIHENGYTNPVHAEP